jgi:DNA-binding PadR family transcriptional regulator
MHSHERPPHETRCNRVLADEFGHTRKRHGGPFGGPGRGGFGGGWGGGPLGGGPGFGPRGRGRRRRGDVRTALLLLLHIDGARNGYQLMQGLEERSEGRWRPSPGSVYPALAQLEDEGLIRSVQSDSGRTFELTDAGREHVAERGEQKPPWEEEDDEADAFKTFRHALGATAKAAAQVAQEGDPEQLSKAVEILKEARRSLYRLLAGDSDTGS